MKIIKVNRKIVVIVATFLKGKKVRNMARNTRQTRIYTNKLLDKHLN